MDQAPFRFCREESATSAIEYALLCSLIAVFIFATVGTAGDSLLALVTYVSEQVAQATP